MSENFATVTVALSNDNQPNRSYDIAIAAHSLKNLGTKLGEVGLGKQNRNGKY